MKNLVLKSFIASSLLASFAFANGAFIGVDVGYNFKSEFDLSTNEISNIQKAKDKNTELGIKGGYDFDMFKVYGGYYYQTEAKDKIISNLNTKIAWKIHKLVAGADWTPNITTDLKAVIGAYVGFSRIDAEISTKIIGRNFSNYGNNNGVVYGGKIGAAYSFDEHNEVEFGVKAEKSKYSEDKADYDVNIIGAYLGYSYKF
ncbi:MAG: porin family protein [Campylobacter sp.]|nr:porin family protein [Campylobacter sp.]